MKNTLLLMLITLFISQYVAYSQAVYSVDKWMDYLEQLHEEGNDDERMESLFSDLSYLTEHPFPINQVTPDELERLPFLTDTQIESFITYRQDYGPLFSIYELRAIDGFDTALIELLFPFVYVDGKPVDKYPLTVNNLLNQSKNNLIINYNRCFQQKQGYRSYPDSVLEQSPNKKYLGEPQIGRASCRERVLRLV